MRRAERVLSDENCEADEAVKTTNRITYDVIEKMN